MKILVVRFSSIGDILLTTPMIRCLHQRYDDIEIHLLTKAIYKDIYLYNPYIDKLWTINNSPKEIFYNLLNEKFDFLLDLQKNFRSLWLKANLPVEFSSFPKKNLKKLKMVITKKRKPISNVALRYFESAKYLDVYYDGNGLDFFFPENFIFNYELPPIYIAFAISGTYYTKQYPTEYVIEYCKKSDYPVVLLGGKNEEVKGNQIKDEVGNKVFNYCGKLSLIESAFIIKNSILVISNDTGMMHLAVALHKSMISIWGNTVPEFGMYPLYPDNVKILHKYFQDDSVSCRPCQTCMINVLKHFACMKNLLPDKLLDISRDMIKQKN